VPSERGDRGCLGVRSGATPRLRRCSNRKIVRIALDLTSLAGSAYVEKRSASSCFRTGSGGLPWGGDPPTRRPACRRCKRAAAPASSRAPPLLCNRTHSDRGASLLAHAACMRRPLRYGCDTAAIGRCKLNGSCSINSAKHWRSLAMDIKVNELDTGVCESALALALVLCGAADLPSRAPVFPFVGPPLPAKARGAY